MNEIDSKKHLYIFGKNSTICKGVVDSKGRSHAPSTLEAQEYWHDTTAIIDKLKADGHVIALCSNEGGVAWGIVEASEAELMVKAAADFIGAKAYRVSCTHPNGKIAQYAIESPDRMPAPGMLFSLMNELGFIPAETIMVGEWADEKRAAEMAGIEFRWSNEFFNRTDDPFADRFHAALGVK